MRTKILISTALVFGVLTIGVRSADISWWTFTGGGGLSQDGSIALGGAIGPIAPALSPATGGNYTLSGGFWGIIAAGQSPGAPLLSIARTTTNTVAVSWPSPSPGFNLQVNTNGLASANWSNVITAPTDDGTTKTVVVNPPTGNRFYRLFKP